MAALRRHLLPFLFVLYLVAYLDRVNISFAAAGVSHSLGLNSASYGVAAGIFFVGYVLFEVPSNLILQRVGARRWISRILISWGVVAVLMAFMTSVQQFNLLRLLLGVAEAGFFPGIILFLSQWVPRQQLVRTLAGFLLALPVAGLLGGPISAALLSLHQLFGLEGWRWLFLLEGLPAILLAFAVWRWLPNHPGEARWLPVADAEALEQVLQRERQQRQEAGGQIHGLRAMLRDPRMALLCLLYMGMSTGLYGFSFWIPRFVTDALAPAEPTPMLVNLLSAIPYGLAVLSMVLVGRFADHHVDRRWTVALPLAVAASALMLALPLGGLPRLALISLATAAGFACLGPAWSMPLQFLGGDAAAGGIATINSVGNIGGFLAPIVMGRLMLLPHGETLALAALAAVLALSACLAVPVALAAMGGGPLSGATTR